MNVELLLLALDEVLLEHENARGDLEIKPGHFLLRERANGRDESQGK